MENYSWRSKLSLFEHGILYLWQPLFFKISIIHICKVKKNRFALIVENSSNNFSTTFTSSSIELGDSLYYKDWITLKNQWSKIFKLGEFIG